ncbi:MAG: tetratricopeptide (TPR) repeat protein, partial [Flammeovirgaceae bacterium]
MKKICFFLLFTFYAISNFAQQADVPFDKNNFPKEQKKQFKEAMDAFEEGDGYVEDMAYHKAIDYYQAAYKFNPHSAALNFQIGVCYLLSPHDNKMESLRYFAYSYKLNPNQSKEIHYYLGRGNHLLKKWDEAIQEYKEFMKYSQEAPIYDYGSVFKRVEECKTGKRMSQEKPRRVFIDNLGSIVNSAYPDYCPIVTADETMMVFTAKRPTTQGGEQGQDYHYYEDIYVSHKQNGVWSKAENLGDHVNNKYNDATVGLSPDGTRMLIFREGDLFECDFEGTDWSSPKDLGKNINTKKYKESSASFSFDGKQLFFTSDRPDLSRGGMDIFVSDWDEAEEEWGKARNLGFNINTEFDEEGVFIHPDGKTMYFSSRGHNTMGGYDIFKSEYSA